MERFQAGIRDDLILFVRHLAWLQAVPRPPKGSKRADAFDANTAISRRAQMKKDGIEPQMPFNPAPHIIDILVEIGLVETAGMGAVPLSWREIAAWQFNACIRLPPWVARLLRRLSSEYLSESRRAEDENCPPPWLAPSDDAAIRAEIRALDAILG